MKVLDSNKFDEFCCAIEPLLVSYGGRFCYDLNVPVTRFSSKHKQLNHVYSMQFDCKENMQLFFADRDYLKTRGRHILKSIGSEQVIFGFEKVSSQHPLSG